MYNAAEYPQGVPNPDVPDVSLYPTYEHGPDYTRAVFGHPWVERPFNVLSGLGFDLFEEQRAEQRAAFYKGVGAASALGLLLVAVGAPKRTGSALAQAAVAFGLVGLVASGVTYATWPRLEP